MSFFQLIEGQQHPPSPPPPNKRNKTYSWTFILHILSDINKCMKNVLKSGSPSSFHADKCLHMCPHFVCWNKKATPGIMMCTGAQKWDTGCERRRSLTDLFHSVCPASGKCFEKYGSTKIVLANRTTTHDHDTKLSTCLCWKKVGRCTCYVF